MKRTNTTSSYDNKKSKKYGNNEGNGNTFEDELYMMAEENQEDFDYEYIASDDINDSEIFSIKNPNNDSQEHKWPRRKLPLKSSGIDDNHDSVVADKFGCGGDNESLSFHWLDIDMTSGSPLEINPDGGSIIGNNMILILHIQTNFNFDRIYRGSCPNN